MPFVFRLLFSVAMMYGALGQQRTLKPVTDDCKHTENLSGGNYSLRFCKPESGVLQDYLRVERDVEGHNEDGRATLSDRYYEFGGHWELLAAIIRFKDGHPIGLDETRQTMMEDWRRNNEVLDTQTGEHNECYGFSTFRGLMRNKDGNKVFIKAILSRNDMLVVRVTTYCKNGVCDPDKYGYSLLGNFGRGPSAYDPKCGYL